MAMCVVPYETGLHVLAHVCLPLISCLHVHLQDKESRDEMLGYLRTISVSSSKLLLAAKALSADPNAPNVMNQLAAAARAVTDAINSLLNLCSSSGPGQKECDNALRSIEVSVREGGGRVDGVCVCVCTYSVQHVCGGH